MKNIQLTEQEMMLLVVLAQVALGQVKLNPDQERQLAHALKSVQPFVQEVAGAIKTGKGSKEAVETAANVIKWVEENAE